MHLAYVIALFLPIIALEASDGPCCYPEKFSGTAYVQDRKVYQLFSDYSRQQIVQVFNSRGLRAIVIDLNTNIRYRFNTDGQCRSYDMTPEFAAKFSQCPPENADIVKEDEDSATYTYHDARNREVSKTVKKIDDGKCLPVELTLQMGRRRSATVTFTAANGIHDKSVFDEDLASCHHVNEYRMRPV